MYEVNEEEIEAVKKVLLSKKYFRYQGKNVETECTQFERELAHYIGNDYSVFVTSGTNALHLALKMLGVGPGDEVIVPCFTFFATPLAVIQAGAIPVIAQVDDHLTISVSDIEKKITPNTKAIIPVHIDGMNCDMKSLVNLSVKYNIPLIEDVAQAVGGSYNRRKLGSLGDFGCFSFNVDKIISCGEGGAITSNGPDNKKKAILLHDTCAQFGITYKEDLSSMPMTAMSMRMSDISAAIMRVQLRKNEKILHRLRERKNTLVEELLKRGIDSIKAHDPAGDCGTSLHLKVSDPMMAMDIAKALAQSHVKSIPLMMRPGHFYWQWQNLLKPGMSFDPRLDPYQGKDETQFAKDLSSSRMFLSSLIKVHVNYDLTVEETVNQAITIANVMEKWNLK